jgi:hypothetical protein
MRAPFRAAGPDRSRIGGWPPPERKCPSTARRFRSRGLCEREECEKTRAFEGSARFVPTRVDGGFRVISLAFVEVVRYGRTRRKPRRETWLVFSRQSLYRALGLLSKPGFVHRGEALEFFLERCWRTSHG